MHARDPDCELLGMRKSFEMRKSRIQDPARTWGVLRFAQDDEGGAICGGA